MAKRRTSPEASLPLFDLPLQGEGEQAVDPVVAHVPPFPPEAPEQVSEPVADSVSEPVPAQPMATEPVPGPAGGPVGSPAEQPMLFSPDELEHPGEDPVGFEPEAVPGQAAPVQDRLLGGLADLTLLLAVLGVVIVSTQWMGVRVSLLNWPPFLLFGLLFSFPYAVIPLAFWGQTPGMAWVGHVARSHDDEPLTFDQTARRWGGALLTVGLVGLPLLMAFSGGSLADRLSDSKTVLSH